MLQLYYVSLSFLNKLRQEKRNVNSTTLLSNLLNLEFDNQNIDVLLIKNCLVATRIPP